MGYTIITIYILLNQDARCIKNSNLRKEVGITIKSKETSSQLKVLRDTVQLKGNLIPTCELQLEISYVKIT